MTRKIIKKEIQLGGRSLSLEYGELAAQANGAVLARYGETVVLATATSAKPRVEADFLPLTVDYIERLYAGGRIKGSRFVKREGRPSDEAILAGRIIDRTIRPLFPKDFRDEVQIVLTVLSVDLENDPVILGLVGAAAALACSDIPWAGPAAAVRVGRKSEEGSSPKNFFLNPTDPELVFSDLDLIVSAAAKEVLMVEGGAQEITEEDLLEAIEFGQAGTAPIIKLINDLADEVGVKKKEFEVDEQIKHLREDLSEFALAPLKKIVEETASKEEFKEKLETLSEEVFKKYEGTYQKSQMAGAMGELTKKAVRELVIVDGKRVDGRKLDEVRPLYIRAGVLPRTHGSAIFQRGETQVLTIATLGSTSLEQLIEGPAGEETKRYIHHYNFPPFSTGEVGRMGSPGRREIGHSALAERALERMIPPEEKFPYTILLVSEVLSSNGSTSMASTCGSSLALMDAGVPIKAPVSGVAMGLFTDGKTFRVLTDIAGIEDQCGDMDFKIAGTEKGVTAVQMDMKVEGLPHKVMEEALEHARRARLHIMEEMLKVIGKPREKLSKYAPKVVFLKIPVEKIGEVIGPGGKMIKAITEKTETMMDVGDDGTINISGQDEAKVNEAKKIVEDLTREITVGEIFDGTVKRVTDFGAFVEILPGKDGLVHVSELAPGYVERVSDVVAVDDKFKVKVIGVDDQGRIKLSKKALEPGGDEVRTRRPDFGSGEHRPRFQSRYSPRGRR
ncbi:polyribonucleotide nucleotidyltransferase [candidate division WWE3 bacterium RIFCSPHIGHO2_01_FULL_48_15]|uniref:Polyribonucleotide nucleotidyltransferase n=1 Tax=candidate division WWE3 bacterium RIFCSPHIGHO2_01_FULL_48_15 TaxID=1802619 RepID=A0A1F4VC48_UNCKA|nr:MAG: polyribonucleotide nucleotidyltransferase [candidate division WWE3 bacterium RIFCSPHIGHO2_01_FULL_48_15]